MESVDKSVEVTVFDAFPSTSPLEASDQSQSSPPSKVAPDFRIEKESTPPLPDKLQARRGRGRPRRQAPYMPQEVAIMEPKRKLRIRKYTEVAPEDPWTNLLKAPLLTPLSPKKSGQARAFQKPQPPVNRHLSPYMCFTD